VQVLFGPAPRNAEISYQKAPRIPIRQNLLSPDGTVHRIPLNPRAPDAHTIIAAIQFVIEQFGRDPRVRQATLQLLGSRINNDLDAHARTVARWVMSRMVYLPDPDGGEFIQTPLVLLQTIAEKGVAYGDCDDHVVLLGAMLNSIGIPARAVAVKLGGTEWFDHVVIEYPANGRTVTMDPCAKFGAAPRYLERLVTA
jgi:transglutaminase-like putative cysteine protease